MFPIAMLTSGRTEQLFAMMRYDREWQKIKTQAVADGIGAGEVSVTERLVQVQMRWEDGGRRVYELTPELTAAFAETEFPLAARDIPLPHPVFYVAIPKSGLLVNNGHDDLALDGWYVDASEPNALQILAVSRELDMAYVHFAVPMADEVEKYLVDTMAKAVANTGVNAERMTTWARIVIGTCAYLSCERVSVDRELFGKRREHREHIADKKRLAAEAVSINYFRLGAREQFSEHFSATADTRRLTRRFVVRGHYRRLAGGKTTWVRPHWRGPDWATMAKATITKIKE